MSKALKKTHSFPLEERLRQRISSGKKVFVPYVTAGLPSPQRFVELIASLAPFSDAIEIGIPFSDPMMDGPIIQEASTRALGSGVTVSSSFEMMREALRHADVPLVPMTYFNPVYRAGLEKFARMMHEGSAPGLIVPDLPFEEGRELSGLLAERGIALIQMIAPTTSHERTKLIASASHGWVYAVARLGVTGEQETLGESAKEVVNKIRPHTDVPILLGTGISTGEQAKLATQTADGVIVGSAMMKKVLADDLVGAAALAREFRRSLDS